jgi:hypothetical protein
MKLIPLHRRVGLLLAALATLAPVTGASAAQRQPAREAPTAVAPAMQISPQAAQETKDELERVLNAYPPSLPRVLKLDPTLLTDQTYLQPYPALATFLAQHPEVAHNPAYFLSNYNFNEGNYNRFDPQQRAIEVWRSAIEGFTIGSVMLAIAGALAWMIKTLIDHRRWSRLSKIQAEVHNKLLDRFTSNEDLLAYIQTPAGRKFLESAPIPLDAPRSIGAPLGRILWSVQVGAVLGVGGLGLAIVAQRAVDEVRQPLSALGVVAIALGIGFLVSAVLAYVLSQRLGLFASPPQSTPESRG